MEMGQAPIRTLIVDDEPIARQVLRDELRSVGDVEVVGEAGNGHDALVQIERLKPDLVLLDLQMPGLGGFDVIRRLPQGALPIVIIVTAYDQHAIRAFEEGALDYLLKPVSRERLEKALDRARALRGRTRDVAESLAQLSEIPGRPAAPPSRKVVGRAGEEYFLLNIDARLKGSVFQRVHRNALVNVNHVRKMTSLSSQRWLLTLSNGQEFIVSKRQASGVRQMLQW